MKYIFLVISCLTYLSVNAQTDWQTYQDSLRIELINFRSPNFLIGGPLEELYIRNLITVTHDYIIFNIPLDLHSLDCGAPDCYSTDLSFSFSHDHELVFPNQLNYKIHEYGCVDNEFRISGAMRLVEHHDSAVNYYSSDQRSNLIIIGNDEHQQYVYYFTEAEPNEIKISLIAELLQDLSEEDSESVPYRSSVLLTQEYEQFLNH